MTCGSDSLAASADSRRNRSRYSGSAREVVLQPFDGDRAVALDVQSAVDLAHPPAADELVEPVGAEPLGHRGLAITGNADASRRMKRTTPRATPAASSIENRGIPTTTATCSHQRGSSSHDALALSVSPTR